MKIELDSKHVLNGDEHCYWITTLVANKSGKTHERRVSGYCTTLERAIVSYIDKRLNSSVATSLGELKSEISALKDEVRGWREAVAKISKEKKK